MTDSWGVKLIEGKTAFQHGNNSLKAFQLHPNQFNLMSLKAFL